MHKITKRAISLWRELPEGLLGQMPYSYAIRQQLAEEYGTTPAKAQNYSMAAVHTIKAGGTHPAGRPKGTKLPIGKRRVSLNVRVAPETLVTLKRLTRDLQISQGKLIDALVKRADE